MKVMRRRTAFTLVEVLVAVAILGLVGTGALKLVMMGQRGLEEVRVQERLLDEGRALQLQAMAGNLPESGASGDLEWEIGKHQVSLMEGSWNAGYHLLEVRYRERRITLCLP